MVKSLHHSHQVNQSIYNNYNRDSKKEDEHRRSQKQASNKAKILKKEEEEFKIINSNRFNQYDKKPKCCSLYAGTSTYVKQ